MQMRTVFLGIAILATAVTVGCGGGSGSSLPAAPHTTSKKPQTVTVKVVIPAAQRTDTAAVKRRMAIAEGTLGIALVVYPHPQASSSPLQTDAFDISPASTSCTTNADASRTCSFALALAPGTYDVDATTYDSAPVSGAIPGTAHALGYQALVGFVVSQGAANSVNLSIDGIAASAVLTLPVPTVRGLDAIAQQASIDVLDANGDVILSNGFVDSLGNPVTVSLSDAATTGLVSFSPSTVVSPPPTGVTVTYNPATITAAQMTAGALPQLTATLSSGPSTTTAMTVVAPLTVVSLPSPAAHGIAASGSIYVPLSNPSHPPYVAVIAPNLSVSEIPVATVSSTPAPYDIAVGSDGNLWMTDSTSNDLLVSNTSGSVFNSYGLGAATVGTGIASDGTKLWVAQPGIGYLESDSPSSPPPVPNSSPTPGAQPQFLVKGSDGRMWFSENGVGRIGAVGTSTGTVAEYPVPTTSSAPLGVALGPDGNVWFAENGSGVDKLGSVTTAGTVTEYSTGSASPNFVIAGPDGNIWFTSSSPTPGIGRMSTTGTGLAFFPLPSGSVPGEMVVAGGLIWVVDTESATPRVFGVMP